MQPNAAPSYDVVIMGGALSGASAALLLMRQQPRLRVLMVEKSEVFTRRVGEATVELSTYFLSRCLGLTQYLNHNHLNKQGLRFWYANDPAQAIDTCSEIGGRYMARVPAYLVDRSTLDEEVLRRACAAGAELWRPAQVTDVKLRAGTDQLLTVRYQGEVRELQARWVIDASGVAAFLARREGWWRPNLAHPTTAVWSRWKGVKDMESVDLAERYPKWAADCYGHRSTATNHLFGDGWWAWWIALKNGDISIGVVFDQRKVTWPEGGSLGQRLKDFLCQHPIGRELLADAQWQEGDVHWRKNLPYYSTTFAGDGFSLVGDAAGFLDPFYSPGMDWIAFTVWSTVELIVAQRRGECLQKKIAMHNCVFAKSYRRWFEAVYQDKYFYMGEFDLMRVAFIMDLGLYYLGVANQPYLRGTAALREPLYSTKTAVPFFYFMRTYNRRLAAIAETRRRRGMLGRMNSGHCFQFKGFTFSNASALPVLGAIRDWFWLELKEGWRSWFSKSPAPTHASASTAAAPEVITGPLVAE